MLLHFGILGMVKAYHCVSLLFFFYNLRGKGLDILLLRDTYYNKQASATLPWMLQTFSVCRNSSVFQLRCSLRICLWWLL